MMVWRRVAADFISFSAIREFQYLVSPRAGFKTICLRNRRTEILSPGDAISSINFLFTHHI
jgi:hypothetical protein